MLRENVSKRMENISIGDGNDDRRGGGEKARFNDCTRCLAGDLSKFLAGDLSEERDLWTA